MKYLRDVSIKRLTAGLIALLVIILLSEFFIIRQKLALLLEVEQKIDFVRRTQVNNQQITLQFEIYLNGHRELNGKISALIDEHDNLLKILSEGGKIDKAAAFLPPLTRIQKVTFQNLQSSWEKYKKIMLTSMLQTESVPVLQASSVQVTQPIDTLAVDSLQQRSTEQVIQKIPRGTLQDVQTQAYLAGKWLTLSSWYDKLSVDFQEEKGEKTTTLNNWFFLLVSVDIALLIGLFWLVDKFVIMPIRLLDANTLAQIQTKGMPENEIGKLAIQINDTIEHLRDATEFVQRTGEGNLSLNYKELDSHYVEGKNKLADSLIVMQTKLKALNDDEQKRQWSNEGLAKFVDILRTSNDNIHILGDNIISALVKYTGSNQGGLYTLNEEDVADKHLELISLFAFNIKRYEKKKIKLGEGLLGQTFLEKETTYLNEVPQEYVRITSGLGEANPKSLLMVPLRVDKEIYGIVELASFKEYQPHEIAFVEKLGETIASTLASVKSAQRNRHLIEQFQQQTEEMRAQEEEMRQNMEELQATQEEIARKEQRYIARINELERMVSDESKPDLIALQQELRKKEQEYQDMVQKFELKSREKPKEDDWGLAEEVERELKINLEAIKITREELTPNIGKK